MAKCYNILDDTEKKNDQRIQGRITQLRVRARQNET